MNYHKTVLTLINKNTHLTYIKINEQQGIDKAYYLCAKVPIRSSI